MRLPSWLHKPRLSEVNTGAGTSYMVSLSQRGVAFIAARYGASSLIQAGNVLVLTWWIGPRAYGAFVTAVGITTFLSSITRAGLDTHLVRSEEVPTREDYDTAFTLILLISMFLCLVGWLALPLLNLWLHDRSFAVPYLVLLATIPLVGLAGPLLAKMERALEFRGVAQIEFGGQLCAFVVGAVLAWRGLGVWAPVVGYVAWQAFVLVAARIVSGFAPRLNFNLPRARQMMRFGLGFSASVRVWQLRNLVNPLIVGRFLGTEAVAFVALGVRAVEALGFVRTAVARVEIAALSRLREDPARGREMMQKGARWQIFALGPAFCLLALLGPKFLPTLMGARWSSVLLVFPFIAAAALTNSIFLLEASALFVEGRQWVVTRTYLWHVALFVSGTAVLVPRFGIAGYGWAELAACLPCFLLHDALTPNLRVSLKACLPWLFGFDTAILSVAWSSPWRWALWLPLAALLGIRSGSWIVQRFSMSPSRRTDPDFEWLPQIRRRPSVSGD